MKIKIYLLAFVLVTVLNGKRSDQRKWLHQCQHHLECCRLALYSCQQCIAFHGYTLTIDPGVIVKFNDSTALQIDGELHAHWNGCQ
jgi:hypothetical protein